MNNKIVRKTAATPKSSASVAPVRQAGGTAKKSAKSAKSAAKPPVRPAPVTEPAAAVAKPKHKLVRDSFTIPKAEYAVLDALKERAAKLARPVKKSELLRAGISALNGMSDKAFLAAMNGVPSLKTGRPSGALPIPRAKSDALPTPRAKSDAPAAPRTK